MFSLYALYNVLTYHNLQGIYYIYDYYIISTNNEYKKVIKIKN